MKRLCSLETDSNSKEGIINGESVVVNYAPIDFQESNFFTTLLVYRWIINSQAADKWWIIC